MDYVSAAPGSGYRLLYLREHLPENPRQLREQLYYLYGTGLPSADIFTAVLALLIFYPRDVFGGICMAASLGGDTDTIAALYGALAAAHNGGHNIPTRILEQVRTVNGFSPEELADRIRNSFWKESDSICPGSLRVREPNHTNRP